jgi:penicillin-binding protein 1A
MSRTSRQRRRRRRSKPLTRLFLFSFLAMLAAAGGGVAYAVTWVISTANSAAPLSSLSPRIEGQVSEVFASNNELLGYLSTDVLRRAIQQGAQPTILRKATVAIEDRRFFQHGGVDYQGLARAAVRDVFDGSAGQQGGSTLTMQLVGNIYLPQDANNHDLKYKIIQAKYANELEKKHTKNWVLTQYLNDVPYGTVDGQSAYGVAAASQMFFDTTDLSTLDLAQVALLAGLPQAPSEYNPFLYPAAATGRRAEVLAAMVTAGYITQAQADAANASRLQVKANQSFRKVRQPYVFDYIRQQLIKKLGEKVVDRGGLKVYSSINLTDQAFAQQSLAENEGEPGDPQAALVSINPHNGKIVAMAQNTTYGVGKDETTVNYATGALRQTGSAFKVFTLMALIHDEDGNPDDTYYVSKLLNAGWLPADPKWTVHTSEESYAGDINVTRATAASDNTVFAQLGADIGLSKVYNMAYAMGITTPQNEVYPGIIGGLNPGVTPLQMADAYSTLADYGLHHTATIINSVTLPSGRQVSLLDTKPNRVFSGAEAYEGTKTLETVLTEGTAIGDNPTDCTAAGKTGTTSNYTDAYFVGYTPGLTTSVWVGYAASEAESMTDVNGLGPGFGGTLAAPIWKDYMNDALGGSCAAFPVPSPAFVGKAYDGAHSSAKSYTSTTPAYDYYPSTETTGTGTSTVPGETTPGETTPGETTPAVTTPAGGGGVTTPAPAPTPPAPVTGGGATTPSGGAGVP